MGRQSGFAYLFLLFVLLLLAVSVLALGSMEYHARVRSNETELLRIGSEYRRALRSYHEAVVPHVYPRSIDELLLDRRGGMTRRHLRKLYADPVTGELEWGMVLDQGAIIGFHSLSGRQPMKVAGFAPEDIDFEGAESYSDWVFSPVQLRSETRLGGVRGSL